MLSFFRHIRENKIAKKLKIGHSRNLSTSKKPTIRYNVFVYSTGATVISKLLMNNCPLEQLRVNSNAIGVEGACVILQSAVNNEACQADISINNEYQRDSEIRTLKNIMEDRWSWMVEDRRRKRTNVVGYLV